jgi:hypothetical protein
MNLTVTAEGMHHQSQQVKLILYLVPPGISQISDSYLLVIRQGSRPSEGTAYNWHTLSRGGFPSS